GMRYWHAVVFRTHATTVTPLAAMLFLAVALFVLAGRVTKVRSERLLLSVAGLALHLTGGVGPGETLYWMTGAVVYEIPNALLLLLAAVVIDLARGEGARVPRLAAAAALAAAAGGSHYCHIVAAHLIVAAGIVYSWKRCGRIDLGLVAVFAAGLASGLASV